MDKENKRSFFVPIKSQEQAIGLMEKLVDVAQPGAVYGEPVTIDDHTIITASEVSAGLGFGYGIGGGTAPESEAVEEEPEAEVETEHQEAATSGFGGGGGGGGGSMARPVAVISVGPEGVQVEPVVDVTKIALALFTMIGSIFVMGARMRKLQMDKPPMRI